MSSDPSLTTVLAAWSFDPNVVLGVVLTALIYLAGLRELSRRGRLRRSVAPRHVLLFTLGLLSIVLALESPIDALSSRLLTAHMVQHMLLLFLAPPFLLLGKPIPVLVVGAPRPIVRWLARGHARRGWFRGLTHLLTNPYVAWLAFIGNMLVWHLPACYDAALRNDSVHYLEHLCFLVTGIMFWWVIVQPYPGRPRVAYGWRVLYILAAMVPGTALGMLFIFAGTAIYPFYAALPRMWDMSVVTDQSFAGTIMMVAGDFILICAAIPLFAGMMERLEEMELARFARSQQE